MWLDLLRELLYVALQGIKHIPWLGKKASLRLRMDGPWAKPGVLWMHGASLGECGVLLQVSRELGTTPILITTQKVEVCQWLRERVPAHVQCALAPLDHPSVVKRFLQQAQPKALVLCENELWISWILGCALHGIPVAMVSGILSEKAARRWLRYAPQDLRLALQHVNPLWVQNQESAARFAAFGKQDTLLGGDWKWLSTPAYPSLMQMDTVTEWETRPVDLALISIHREDWPRIGPGLVTYAEFGGCTVLIPRWPKDIPYFAKELIKAKVRICFWPKLERGAISLVDQFGLVRTVLDQSRLALVGGSFSAVGVHNFREPLFSGVPVLVGPNGGNYESELKSLRDSGVLYRLGNLEELCLGRQGRDAWVSTWFPWEKRFLIPQALADRKSIPDMSFRAFQQWLYQLRIFAS